MVRKIRILGLTMLALLLPVLAAAQAPPPSQTPVAPKTEPDPNCANSDTQTAMGKGGTLDTQADAAGNLSEKLARSGGVICPPDHVDPEIKQPTPPGGAMPVIPPPGRPGGDQSIQPK